MLTKLIIYICFLVSTDMRSRLVWKKEDSHSMASTQFESLRQLVFVDILAALPLGQVLRIARLGHERLRKTGNLKWVTDRMREVDFGAVRRAWNVNGNIATTFCAESVTKRLKGRVDFGHLSFVNYQKPQTWLLTAKKVPGTLHLVVKNDSTVQISEWRRKHQTKAFHKLPELTYVSGIHTKVWDMVEMIGRSPKIVFEYNLIRSKHHSVHYRPALLNGRHVVDVLRAVCGPADVSEAELDRAKRSETERMRTWRRGENWSGVWSICWLGAAIITPLCVVET